MLTNPVTCPIDYINLRAHRFDLYVSFRPVRLGGSNARCTLHRVLEDETSPQAPCDPPEALHLYRPTVENGLESYVVVICTLQHTLLGNNKIVYGRSKNLRICIEKSGPCGIAVK